MSELNLDWIAKPAPVQAKRESSRSSSRVSVTPCREKIIQLRRQLGLTQQALANICGLSERVVRKMECGQMVAPGTIRELVAGLARLGVQCSEQQLQADIAAQNRNHQVTPEELAIRYFECCQADPQLKFCMSLFANQIQYFRDSHQGMGLENWLKHLYMSPPERRILDTSMFGEDWCIVRWHIPWEKNSSSRQLTSIPWRIGVTYLWCQGDRIELLREHSQDCCVPDFSSANSN